MALTIEEIEIKVKSADAETGLKNIKSAIKDLQSEATAFGEGSAEFNKLTEAAGELQRKLDDVKEASKLAASEGLFKVGESFKQLSAKIAEGDFKGAGDKIKVLSATISKVDLKSLIGGFKQLGGTIIQLGKAILANPIFLIAGIIIAVVVAVVKLKDNVKFLGEIFDAIGEEINKVVQALKDFADWLGITSFAADEAAQKNIDNAKKQQEALTTRYDREIQLAEIAGEETKQLELDKQNAIIETNKIQIKNLNDLISRQAKATDEQKEQLEELVKANEEAQFQITVINAKSEADRKKQAEIAAKEEKDKAKERNNNYKKSIQDNLDVLKTSNELSIITTKEGTKERIEAERQASDKIIKFYEKYGPALGMSKDEVKLITEKENQKILKLEEDLNKKIIDQEKQKTKAIVDEKKKQKADEEDLIAKLKALRDELYLSEKEKQIKEINSQKEQRLALLEEAYKKGLISEATYNQGIIDINKKANGEIDKLNGDKLKGLAALTAQFNKFIKDTFGDVGANISKVVGELVGQIPAIVDAFNTLDQIRVDKLDRNEKERLDQLERQKAAELDNANLTGEQKEVIEKSYAQKEYEIQKSAAEQRNAINKKIFERNKKLQLVQAVIATAKGINSALFESGVPFPYSIPLGVLAGALGAVQIKKIASSKFEGEDVPLPPGSSSSGIGGGGSGSAQGATQRVIPNTFQTGGSNVTGSGANNNNSGSGQNNNVVRAYVLNSDIASESERAAQLNRRATFGTISSQ